MGQIDSGGRDLDLYFREFAAGVCRGSSPLYDQIATEAAGDPEILAIAANTRRGQPTNLFFAAVHYLLLKGIDHRLASHYASVSNERRLGVAKSDVPITSTDAYQDFRSFCLDHRDQIIQLISTRVVQTNEVARYACMLPAFLRAAARAEPQPIALIEIGASAGLGMIWDRYYYQYRVVEKAANREAPPANSADKPARPEWGDADSLVKIDTEVRGNWAPCNYQGLTIATRTGVDLFPVDIGDPDRVLWLRSFIFPEQTDRDERLQSAVGLALRCGVPGKVARGDAVDLIPGLLDAVPEDEVPCVFNSFALSQISPERRRLLLEAIAKRGRQRKLVHVSLEWLDGPSPLLNFSEYGGSSAVPEARTMARCDPHGRWIEPLTTV